MLAIFQSCPKTSLLTALSMSTNFKYINMETAQEQVNALVRDNLLDRIEPTEEEHVPEPPTIDSSLVDYDVIVDLCTTVVRYRPVSQSETFCGHLSLNIERDRRSRYRSFKRLRHLVMTDRTLQSAKRQVLRHLPCSLTQLRECCTPHWNMFRTNTLLSQLLLEDRIRFQQLDIDVYVSLTTN